jgi:hypothetical protein
MVKTEIWQQLELKLDAKFTFLINRDVRLFHSNLYCGSLSAWVDEWWLNEASTKKSKKAVIVRLVDQYIDHMQQGRLQVVAWHPLGTCGKTHI